MAKGRKTGGRKKGGVNKVGLDVRALAQVHTELAINTLASIAKDTSAPQAARVSASEKLLERGWGKTAATTVEIDKDGGKVIVEIVV